MHRSLYASPGCRAFGHADVLDDRYGEQFAGLHVATAARTGFVELLRMPCWGMATQKNRGTANNIEEHLMLGLMIVHPPGEPDKAGLIGMFAHNGASIQHAYKKFHLKPRYEKERDSLWADDFWLDVVPLSLFDPGVTVFIGRSEKGLASMDAEKNTFVINGVLTQNNKQYMVFAHLHEGAGMADLLDLLSELHREMPVDIGVLPASGSVAASPSFDTIPSDIFSVRGVEFRIGGAPGAITGAAEFITPEGETQLGVLLRRPSHGTGVLLLRRLRTVIDFHAHVAQLDEAWRLMSRALVLTPETILINQDSLAAPIQVVPPMAYHAARLDSSRAYPLILIADREGIVRAVDAPLSRAAALSAVCAAAPVGDEPALKEMLHNEIRMQTMPENQDSLSEAITELRGFPLSNALTIVPRLAGGWRGDRAGTLEAELSEAELTLLLGRLGFGWSVPDPPPNRRGMERKRFRNKGFLLILPASRVQCRVTYGLESKSFKLFTPLSLFGENLNFVKGVQPPEEGDMVYDIVTFALRLPIAQPPRSLARAREAFDPPEYGGMAM